MRVTAILLVMGLAQAAGADVVDEFRTACAQRAAEAEKTERMTVVGRDGWLFLDSELRHLSVGRFWGDAAAKASRAERADEADPLPAILDFADQLKSAGIELIIVPVPAKTTVYPGMLDNRFEAAAARVDRTDAEFLDVLRKSGVDVIDLTPAFTKASGDAKLFCQQDSHWSGRGCVLAAGAIAQRVRDRAWAKQIHMIDLASEWRTIEVEGDLWRELPEPRPAKEKVELRFVGRRTDGGLKSVDDDPGSPIVLLGDSSCLVFHDGGDMHATGAGLADQLAMELGFAIDIVAVRGSGATPARVNLMRAARKDGYLAGKKLVIWCFAAREFTEANWTKLKIIGNKP